MLYLKTTVKNKKRRHIILLNDDDVLFDDYVYHDELEKTLLDWQSEYEDVFLTNDIDVIKIMRTNLFYFYDID